MTCEHEWTERDQGPGLRWRECWLCGEMGDYESGVDMRYCDRGPCCLMSGHDGACQR